MIRIILKPGEEKRILSGHPWIYANEIAKTECGSDSEGIADAFSAYGQFLGRGFFNPLSKIAFRIATRQQEPIDKAFIGKRIRDAWHYRTKLIDTETCRIVFGEADFLPGLIVDKFGDILVIQTLVLGIDRFKDAIVSELNELVHPRGIYERNDVKVREKEGLKQHKGFLSEPFPTLITIRENGIVVQVDIRNGQKTGYFLDQKENHAAIRPFSAKARVLDVFSHSGGFALHAAYYGAREVIAVDSSSTAVGLLERNAELNSLSSVIRGVCADAFDTLRDYTVRRESFDLVILDPPAFTKNRSALQAAYRGYKEINLQAMKLLKPGGFLVTCSCSYHMKSDFFLSMLKDAAHDAHRQLRIVEIRGQAKDHPVLADYEESQYLKCVFLQVL